MNTLIMIVGMLLMMILGFFFGVMISVAGLRKHIIRNKYFVHEGEWYLVEKTRLKEFMEKEKN